MDRFSVSRPALQNLLAASAVMLNKEGHDIATHLRDAASYEIDCKSNRLEDLLTAAEGMDDDQLGLFCDELVALIGQEDLRI